MVQSQVISVTPATHADAHRAGGTDPLTGAVAINGLTPSTLVDTSVHSGALTATTWTDLDLSAVVGTKKVLAILRLTGQIAGTDMRFRAKGDTAAYTASGANALGSNGANVNGAYACQVMTLTDTDGICQYYADGVDGMEIDVLGWFEIDN